MAATRYDRVFSGFPDLGVVLEAINSDATIAPKYVENSAGGLTWTEPDDLVIWMSDDLTQDEEDALDVVLAAQSGGSGVELSPVYYEVVYSNGVSGKLDRETWWHTDDGGGTYSDKVNETAYQYQGNKLLSRTETTYWSDGVVRSTAKIGYFTISGGGIVEKEIT